MSAPHNDLSLEDMGAFLASALVAAAVALAFIGYLFWSLSATALSQSLVGTGARDPLLAGVPVPYVEEAR